MKIVISMTNQVNLRSRFTAFLNELNIPHERKYIWKTIHADYKQIIEVQYIIDENHLNVVQLNASADTSRGITFRTKAYQEET